MSFNETANRDAKILQWTEATKKLAEAKAVELALRKEVIEINFAEVTGRQPLQPNEMRYFKEIVTAKTNEIVQKWIDFFVLHKHVTAENITRRLK